LNSFFNFSLLANQNGAGLSSSEEELIGLFLLFLANLVTEEPKCLNDTLKFDDDDGATRKKELQESSPRPATRTAASKKQKRAVMVDGLVSRPNEIK
jgi:hypothetical protein